MAGLGMLGPTALSPQSRKIGLDTELQIKSVPKSIYTALKGLYNAKQQAMPNGIYMKVNEVALKNAWRARITLLERLSEGGVMGGRQAIGAEEQPSTKVAEVYHNNCRKVVSVPGYGIEKLHAEYLNLFEKFIDQLADWNREQEDLEIHQALLETYGETLLHGETAALPDAGDPSQPGGGPCEPRWNPNVFVAGHGAHNQPAYNLNILTHTQNILNALTATPGGAGTFLDTDALSNISNYALLKRIEPLDIPGAPSGKGYVLTISELQAMYIGDPNWSAKNLGTLFIQKTGLNEKVMNWPGVLGMYKDLLLVVDHRTPTVTRDGSTSLTSGYMKHGNIDDRNRDMASGDVFDVGILHGKGAVVKWEPEPLKSIKQDDDYEKVRGVGTACVRGIQIPLYWRDIESKQPDDVPEQFTSAVVLCAMPGEVSP